MGKTREFGGHRTPVGKWLRKRMFVCMRDDSRCAYCETQVAFILGTVDHVLPRSRGGTNCESNLVWCCEPCNTAKGTMTGLEYVRSLHLGENP